jgi:hypothetical protein
VPRKLLFWAEHQQVAIPGWLREDQKEGLHQEEHFASRPNLDLDLKDDLASPEVHECLKTSPQDDLTLTSTSEMIWPALRCMNASRLHLRMTSPWP